MTLPAFSMIQPALESPLPVHGGDVLVKQPYITQKIRINT